MTRATPAAIFVTKLGWRTLFAFAVLLGAASQGQAIVPGHEAVDELVLSGVIEALDGVTPGEDGQDLILRAANRIIILPGTVLRAGNGMAGASVAVEGDAIGQAGGTGGSITLEAPAVEVLGLASVFTGSGGPGGHATSHGFEARAIGGPGGDAGQLVVEGRLVGFFTVVHGAGGQGGDATAVGSSCTGQDGESAKSDQPAATLGPGADANAHGTDGKCGNADARGGRGGDAYARGGDGGLSPNGNGGNGGNANATAGRPGPGQDACFPDEEAAVASGLSHAGDAGFAGSAEAYGGRGGNGTFGGGGGGAIAWQFGAKGGDATPPIAPGASDSIAPGTRLNATAGDGGTGLLTGGSGGGAVAALVGSTPAMPCRPASPAQSGPNQASMSFAPMAFMLMGLALLARIRRSL